MKIKKADFILFLIPILIAVFSLLMLFSQSDGHNTAVISVDGKVVKTVDLSSADRQTINLSLHYNNIIEIKDGKIGIISADCSDKTCVKTGFIGSKGQVIVCVPSKLVIKIIGESNYDVISG